VNYGQRKLRELIEKIALELRDPADNYVQQSDVIKVLLERLRYGNVDEAIAAEVINLVAGSEVRGFFNSRKPKFTSQGSLYFPGFWLPLGKGKRVQMSDASNFDLIAYGDGVRGNREKIDAAEDRTRAYVAERAAALEANPGRRLHWAEVHLFGYNPEEQDPDEYLIGDEDE